MGKRHNICNSTNQFLFDKSSKIYTSPDEICDFYNTKKSTTSNKASEIRKMFNMSHFNEEFSSKEILRNAPRFFISENGFITPLFDDEEYEFEDSNDTLDEEELNLLKENKTLDEWITLEIKYSDDDI